MSPAVPARPTRAMSLSTRASPSTSRNCVRIGVSTGPGLTALTRMPRLLNSVLVRGPERPQQQQFLGDGIAFLVLDVVVGDHLGDIGKALDADHRDRAVEIGAPAEAGDRGDVDDRAAFAQLRRHRFRQRAQPVEIDGERRRRARLAGQTGDIAERIEAARQLVDQPVDAGLGRDVGLDEDAARRRRLAHIDADHVGAELAGKFGRARADARGDAGDEDRLAQQHGHARSTLSSVRWNVAAGRAPALSTAPAGSRPAAGEIRSAARSRPTGRAAEAARRRSAVAPRPIRYQTPVAAEPRLDQEEDDGAEDRALEACRCRRPAP